mmetsp:Transcript_54807/g.119325  ORF Transcript_54807/g.119325 Transcript_54807/m.119325 type:complete len:299 (+) Transcript_54807:1775-2671(+)
MACGGQAGEREQRARESASPPRQGPRAMRDTACVDAVGTARAAAWTGGGREECAGAGYRHVSDVCQAVDDACAIGREGGRPRDGTVPLCRRHQAEPVECRAMAGRRGSRDIRRQLQPRQSSARKSKTQEPCDGGAVAGHGAAGGQGGQQEAERGAHGAGSAGVSDVGVAVGRGHHDGATSTTQGQVHRRRQTLRERPSHHLHGGKVVLGRPQDRPSEDMVQPRGDAQPGPGRRVGLLLQVHPAAREHPRRGGRGGAEVQRGRTGARRAMAGHGQGCGQLAPTCRDDTEEGGCTDQVRP